MIILKLWTLFFLFGVVHAFATTDEIYVDESQLLYPFIVKADDLKDLNESPAGATYEIGHKLYVTLVYDLNGTVRNLVQSDLDRMEISVIKAHEYALDNLANLAETDKIAKRLVQGPDNIPMMVWGGHWLASSCILLPNMHTWFESTMNTSKVLASIPSRDMLMLFPKMNQDSTDRVQRFVRYNNNKFESPLSLRLFIISSSGLEPSY